MSTISVSAGTKNLLTTAAVSHILIYPEHDSCMGDVWEAYGASNVSGEACTTSRTQRRV